MAKRRTTTKRHTVRHGEFSRSYPTGAVAARVRRVLKSWDAEGGHPALAVVGKVATLAARGHGRLTADILKAALKLYGGK